MIRSKHNKLSIYLTLHHCLPSSLSNRYSLRRSGQLPAATPETDFAVDDDCISEVSDCFEERTKKSEKCFISEFKDALINYCISKSCPV